MMADAATRPVVDVTLERYVDSSGVSRFLASFHAPDGRRYASNSPGRRAALLWAAVHLDMEFGADLGRIDDRSAEAVATPSGPSRPLAGRMGRK